MSRTPKFIDVVLLLIQLAIIVLYFVPIPKLDETFNIVLQFAGAIPMVAGGLLALWALVQQIWQLTPFPTPREDANLITHGAYRLVRHPIYAGLIFLAIGYGVFMQDFYKLIFAFLLYIFFEIKAAYEERLLRKRFEGYPQYMVQTGKFFPVLIVFRENKHNPPITPEFVIEERKEEGDQKVD